MKSVPVMMSLMERLYRPAVAGEVEALATSLAAAFYDDPVFGWLLPDAATRRSRIERFFALELEHVIMPVGEVWTTDGLPGAALVAPPGKWRLPISAQARHAPQFARVFGRRLPWGLGLLTKMESKHLKEPHVYFPYIGIRPEDQGRGLGSGVMSAPLAHADEQHLPCYLEATCPDNARLYRRLGFEDIGTLTFLGSPPLALMRRPPG
jgi:ribosomal protein S18 acetylase RimI-like enzyme